MKKLGSILLAFSVLLGFPKISAKTFKMTNDRGQSIFVTLPDDNSEKSQFRTRLLEICPDQIRFFQNIDGIIHVKNKKTGEIIDTIGIQRQVSRQEILPHAMVILTQVFSISSGGPIPLGYIASCYHAFGNNIISYVITILGFLGLI